ncbi:MAG: hypothetical protein M3072_03700, partial [Candidatus Dormibacteraeota bacterium]|nr:hypothetical protein [Candidatus Dormibacteraeota bacterium]
MPASFRYSRWDGSQLFEELDPERTLDALADDLMNYGDLNAALQRLNRWGNQDLAGLEKLLQDLQQKREEELARYDLDTAVDAIREQLQQVVDQERAGIERKLAEAPHERRRLLERMAKQRRDKLARLPDDLGGRVKALRNYEFMDEGARDAFEKLVGQLQQQVMNQ